MPKLTLQFEGRVLKDYPVGATTTIGRLPDNSVMIDNPAVSAHHARVFREGERFILEDLKSTNGTFVNEQHVYRHVLRHRDVILIGKHRLVFDQVASAEAATADPLLEGFGDTMYLDTKDHRALLSTLREARTKAEMSSGARPTWVPPAPPKVGGLRVVAGRTEQPEYDLDAHTSLIGKSDDALVRLRGWFKPNVAVAIARNGDAYTATMVGGKTFVNSQLVSGRYRLRDGDILSVSGLTLEFCLRQMEVVTQEAAAS
jgi:pSer/pThr/pTyr-binding forkhead associated (FHA) protein